LVPANGGKKYSHGKIGRDEEKGGYDQQEKASLEGDMENEGGHQHDQADLDVTDQNIRNYFSDHNFKGFCRGGQECFHGAAFPFAGIVAVNNRRCELGLGRKIEYGCGKILVTTQDFQAKGLAGLKLSRGGGIGEKTDLDGCIRRYFSLEKPFLSKGGDSSFS